MALTLVTPATVEPLSYPDAKNHLRVDNDDESDRITNLLIPSARQWVEGYTGRQMLKASWTLTLPCFPASGEIKIPLPPLVKASVVVTYLDTAGVTQTLAASQYIVEAEVGPTARPGRIVLAYGCIWPSTLEQENAVTVAFDAGYGTTAASVPPQLRWAMLLILSEAFENRGEQTAGSTSRNAISARDLCGDFLVRSFD